MWHNKKSEETRTRDLVVGRGCADSSKKIRRPLPKFGHISEFMRDTLHWLPVRQRIHYGLSTIVCLLCPWHCLLELFILTSSCTGRQSLRFAYRGDFAVPRARTAIKRHRAFSIVGPSAWNSLPSEIRSLPWDLSSSFYKLLKTYFRPGLGAPLISYL